MGWVRKHPELVILAVFVAVVVAGIVRYQTRSTPPAGAAGDLSTSPSAAVPSTPPPSAVSSGQPTDLPQFDRAGSGTACTMTYAPDSLGGTQTVFNLAKPGELVTHVNGPDGLHRHDEREPTGPVVFDYDVPVGQITDMGAVLYLADGSSQSCTISAGSDAP